MTATELATAYLSLVPSLQGSKKAIEKDLGAVDTAPAGKTAGRRYGAALGIGLVAASGLITKGLSDSVAKASDLSESVNAVKVSYGDAADGVLDMSKNSANALGLSSSDFNTLAVQFSGFSKTIAGEGGNVAGALGDISGRAADFASVMNLDVADAAGLFQSGLAGETEPLRKYGIDLSAAAVEAYALNDATIDTTDGFSEAEKVQARYRLLMEKTSNTSGDFAGTSDGLANSQRILDANMDNLQATIGSALLPVMAKLSGAIIPIVQYLSDNQGVLAAIAAVIGVTLVAAFVAWTVSIWASTIALLANPITWIILAIIALIAIVVLLVANWDTVVEAIRDAWKWIKDAFSRGVSAVKDWISDMWDKVSGAFESGYKTVKEWLQKAWDFILEVWSYSPLGFIVENWDAIVDFIKKLPGRIASAASGMWDGIKDAFRSAVNWLIGVWNDFEFTIGGGSILGIDIPKVTLGTPNIPYLAEGGIVTRPTLAMIGEGAGPEAVIPLDRADEFGLGGMSRISPADIEALGNYIVEASRRIARGEINGQARDVIAGRR